MYNILLSDYLGKKRKINSPKDKENKEKNENIKKIKLYKNGVLYEGKNSKNRIHKKNEIETEFDDNDEEYKPEEEQKKEFKPFSGIGKKILNINIKGLKIDKEYKSQIDKEKPFCKINIRLFNGEIANEDFNITQTLQDIINYVKIKSGSNNFSLLDGFPPKPLTQMNKTIEELHLEGSLLTQRIN